MATVKQYLNQLRNAQKRVALKMGVDITQETKSVRVMMWSILALLAVVIKVLVDNGALTDAQLQTAFQDVINDTWPNEPLEPEPQQ